MNNPHDRVAFRSWLRVAALGCAVAVVLVASLRADEAISLDGFRDGINHWKSGQDSDGYSTYEPGQVRQIADNLLRYQRANGGWPPNFDPLRILGEDERQTLAEAVDTLDTSFDNRATYPEIEYLARAYEQTNDERYRQASARGIEFVLAAQYANGGWPHTYPSKKKYYPHITIVDDVMTGILRTLRPIAAGLAPYTSLDASLRSRAAEALARGERCLLRLQVMVDGQLTAWAPQYDEETLEPTTGRTFELPALVSAESVEVLRYLMAIDPPSPEVRRAVEAGVAWLERSKILGLRIERIAAEPVRFNYHTSRFDLAAVEDPQAPSIWARFYQIETNRPCMANRDGQRVFRLADVQRERRTGYSWYGYHAQKLLEDEYPAWHKKWATQ